MSDCTKIIAFVAALYGTPRRLLCSRSRVHDVLLPRQLAMYLCYRCTSVSVAGIARMFHRHHPAVHNAILVVSRHPERFLIPGAAGVREYPELRP